jgi:hypothetical protein
VTPPKKKVQMVVPLTEVRYLADNMSYMWVVRHMSNKTLYPIKGSKHIKNVSSFDNSCKEALGILWTVQLCRQCCECLARI